VRQAWASRLDGGPPLREDEALRLIADYGIPVVRAKPASTVDDAVAVAAALGWPVVLKTAAPGIGHKSDVDGVRLGLMDADAVRDAYADLARRLGPEVLVQAMAPPGAELAAGVVRDEQFGPLVLVAAGGTLIELVRDRALALPPVDEVRAGRLLDRLSLRPILDGIRGGRPTDLEAVVHALTCLSTLATELGDRLDAVDVNPVIAGPAGCLAVDALVVPRTR
jgi:succinyl-CoA synthetase beta subunit